MVSSSKENFQQRGETGQPTTRQPCNNLELQWQRMCSVCCWACETEKTEKGMDNVVSINCSTAGAHMACGIKAVFYFCFTVINLSADDLTQTTTKPPVLFFEGLHTQSCVTLQFHCGVNYATWFINTNRKPNLMWLQPHCTPVQPLLVV